MTATARAGEHPIFASIIIAVHNDWQPLLQCLQALSMQRAAPPFEIIVVDDGSTDTMPPSISVASSTPLTPLKIISRPHSGIAAARNEGIRNSSGEILIFVDADCVPHDDCLASVAKAIAAYPGEDCFQLELEGDPSSLAGRTEHLRLTALQQFRSQASGHIRYLNTSAFAIRRSAVDVPRGLFDLRVLCGEDTLLLANLFQQHQLPLFVPGAVVRHDIGLTVPQIFQKAARSAFKEATAHAIIAEHHMNVRFSLRERLQLLRLIWNSSKSKSTGTTACLVLIARQSLRFVILALCRVAPWLAVRPKGQE